MSDGVADFAPRAAPRFRAKADIVTDVEPGKKSIILKHHAAARAGRGDRHAPHQIVALGSSLKARGHPQQSGFAATGCADQADEFAFLDAEIGAAQRLDGATVLRIGLADVLHFQDGN